LEKIKMGKSGCIPCGVSIWIFAVLISTAISSPKIFWPIAGLTAVLVIAGHFLDKRRENRANKD
jgi:hypothetical protein